MKWGKEKMFANLELRWKISIILVIIMSIMMSIVGIVNYISTTQIIRNEVNAKIQIINKLYKSTINSIFVELDGKIKELAEDDSLVSYVDIVDYRYQELNKQKTQVNANRLSNETEIDSEREKLNNLINSNLENYVANTTWGYLENFNYVDFSYITLIDGMVISSSSRNTDITNIAGMKKSYLEKSEYERVNLASVKIVNQKPYILFNTSIKESNKVIGYLVLGISLNSLKGKIDTTLGEYSNDVTLINNNAVILNNPSRDKLGQIIEDEWIQETIKSEELPVDKLGTEKYYLVDKLENNNLYLAASVLKSDLLAPANRLGRIDIYIFIVGIIFTILIIYITIGWQLKPLHLLLNKMGKVRKGDLDVQINTSSNDEIGMLGQTFNKMINDLRELMIKVKEDQGEIRKLELSALQLQINPHFLYNTLDSISLMTKTKEYDEIAEMCIALSQFFRLGLNDGKETYTIREEIEHVKNYIIIQKLRYPDKFEYTFNVEEDIYNNECIKIVLQPLVENSLQHGFKYYRSKGHIYINGYSEGNKVILQVIDNGCGFDEAMIKSFSIPGRKQMGYALSNVDRRIQLYYGEDYGLTIYNTESGGACVELSLPAKFKGDGFNCIS